MLEAKRQGEQEQREQIRTKVLQERKREQQNIEYPDRTEDFIKQMLLNAVEARTWRYLPIWGQYQFYTTVNHNGKWDYKVNTPRWMPDNKQFTAFGIKMTAEMLGNFNYGFTGAATGFSPTILFAGGGYAAITSNMATWEDWENYFDSDEDHLWIVLGILAYSMFDPAYAIGNLPVEAVIKKTHPELWLAMVKSFKQTNGENKP